MDYEELRPLVLEALKQKSETQIVPLIHETEQIALQKGLYSNKQATEHRMPHEDKEKVREIIWDLVLQGILFPGVSEYQAGLPFLKVTRYGKEVLDAGHPIPYDPDGYLSPLKKDIPKVDTVILTYVSESLQTFLRGNILASAVMLGVASEKAVLLLIDAYANAIADSPRRQDLQRKFEQAFSVLRARAKRKLEKRQINKLTQIYMDMSGLYEKLIRIFVGFIEILEGKETSYASVAKRDLFPNMEKLKKSYPVLTRDFNITIRNSIAHPTYFIRLSNRTIRFVDRRSEVTLSFKDFFKACRSLSALVLALGSVESFINYLQAKKAWEDYKAQKSSLST